MMKRFFWTITTGVLIAVLFGFPYQNVSAQEGICTAEFQSVALPLTDLGAQEYVRMDGQPTGFIGGLYPQGSNAPPAAHLSAGLQQASLIQPLDLNGQPNAENGKVVMISIGMSNTNAEFGSFIELARRDPEINQQLVLVNGALANQTSDRWTDPDAVAWQVLADKLDHLQISPLQVQAAWIKLTRTRGGDFPEKAQALQADLEMIVRNLKTTYPNVKIAYLSSRIYSYTYWNGLSPEPNAYETGFAVRWLIEQQINGDPELNYDLSAGEMKAPLLLWGPYLWADGQNPRADGLTWMQVDLTQDCTHPHTSGQQKVANLLLDFFKSDGTSSAWFLQNAPKEENYRLFIPFLKSIETESSASTVILAEPTGLVLERELVVVEKKPEPPPSFFELFFLWLKSLFWEK